MTSAPLRPPISYFGSKVRMAPRLVDLMPDHGGYIEPYCGSLAVLLAKPPVPLEVVNDIDRDLVTFWRVLRNRPDDLERVCALTPHSRAEYDSAWPIPADIDDLERARIVWLRLTQARAGALRFTGWRYYEVPRGAGSSMPRTLHGYIGRFAAVAARLANVTLECRDRLEVVAAYGRDRDNLLYVDPPYLFDNRSRTGAYRYEAGDEQHHRDLAAALAGTRAAVVVSGYASPLYDELYAGWDRAELAAGTGQNTDAGWQERTEVVWCNRELRRQRSLWVDDA